MMLNELINFFENEKIFDMQHLDEENLDRKYGQNTNLKK